MFIITISEDVNGKDLVLLILDRLLTINHKYTALIYQNLSSNAIRLINHENGSLVLKKSLEVFGSPFCFEFFKTIKYSLKTFCKQKFSSRVLEKFIEMASKDVIKRFIAELSKLKSIVDIVRNSYGNYVIQTLLEFAKSDEDSLKSLIDNLHSNVKYIKNEKIKQRWEEILVKCRLVVNMRGNIA